MQIDTDVGEDQDEARDHLNRLSDVEDHDQQQQHAKASASALAVAAAAAQAHLNGTSEYISRSNFCSKNINNNNT